MSEAPSRGSHPTSPRPEGGAATATSLPLPSRVWAVLPARAASTRLPGKVLLDETGLPLFVHSAHNVARCAGIGRVVVATDSNDVLHAGAAHGIEVVMTRSDHPSGTDRVREAVDNLSSNDSASVEVILNVQADEPDVDIADLDRLLEAFSSSEVQIATLAAELGPEERESPSVVKVVRDARGDALYFSRAPIPSEAHPRPGAAGTGLARRHVGVYGFRPAALTRFTELPVGELERQENLEQLRWLEAGERIRVLDARHVPRGIDTRDDYESFVARTRAGDGVNRQTDA